MYNFSLIVTITNSDEEIIYDKVLIKVNAQTINSAKEKIKDTFNLTATDIITINEINYASEQFHFN